MIIKDRGIITNSQRHAQGYTKGIKSIKDISNDFTTQKISKTIGRREKFC